MRITRKNICEAIKDETGYSVGLERGNGYFYFYYDGDDQETISLVYGKMKSTSVLVYHLGSYSIERWVEEFKSLAEDV